MSVPAPVMAPGAGRRADRDAGRHRAGTLHHAMRARLGRGPVHRDGRQHQDASFGFRGSARYCSAPAGGRNGEFLPALSDCRSEPRCVRPSPSRSGSGPVHRRPSTARRVWPKAGSRAPGLTPDEARKQADTYRERCAASGKRPGAIVLRRDVYVGASSSEAQTVLQHALSRGYRGMPAEALIAGSVEEVAERSPMPSGKSGTPKSRCDI